MNRAEAANTGRRSKARRRHARGESAAPAGKRERVLKTLDRVISKAGAGSRTEARQWIGAGRVKVNGKVIQTPDHWVDPERDKIALDGKPLAAEKKRYVLLYKPKGYLTTYKDPEGRPTVYDLLEGVTQFLGNVGRLDKDTSGLLLLTNDTQLAERLTNPDHLVPKTYLVKAASLLTDEQIERLRQGVQLDDGPTRPAEVTRLRDNPRHTFLEITITEGRNRQVRRMLEAVDSRVLKLVRTRIGPLTIGDLPIGKWRDLTAEEVRSLQGKRRRPILAATAL
jgi:pseudouridine synthase